MPHVALTGPNTPDEFRERRRVAPLLPFPVPLLPFPVPLSSPDFSPPPHRVLNPYIGDDVWLLHLAGWRRRKVAEFRGLAQRRWIDGTVRHPSSSTAEEGGWQRRCVDGAVPQPSSSPAGAAAIRGWRSIQEEAGRIWREEEQRRGIWLSRSGFGGVSLEGAQGMERYTMKLGAGAGGGGDGAATPVVAAQQLSWAETPGPDRVCTVSSPAARVVRLRLQRWLRHLHRPVELCCALPPVPPAGRHRLVPVPQCCFTGPADLYRVSVTVVSAVFLN